MLASSTEADFRRGLIAMELRGDLYKADTEQVYIEYRMRPHFLYIQFLHITSEFMFVREL